MGATAGLLSGSGGAAGSRPKRDIGGGRWVQGIRRRKRSQGRWLGTWQGECHQHQMAKGRGEAGGRVGFLGPRAVRWHKKPRSEGRLHLVSCSALAVLKFLIIFLIRGDPTSPLHTGASKVFSQSCGEAIDPPPTQEERSSFPSPGQSICLSLQHSLSV